MRGSCLKQACLATVRLDTLLDTRSCSPGPTDSDTEDATGRGFSDRGDNGTTRG